MHIDGISRRSRRAEPLSYYCTLFVPGKTAERGIETDSDDKIIDTFYGDKCYDTWITLGYAFFSENFSKKMISFIEAEFDLPETANKFWADIQDEHLADLYMYAKRCNDGIIHEFDSLEELRDFDEAYRNNSNSSIMKKLMNKKIGCYEIEKEQYHSFYSPEKIREYEKMIEKQKQ